MYLLVWTCQRRANASQTHHTALLPHPRPLLIRRHTFISTEDYEIGNGIWPVQRNRTLFITSVVPIAGQTDTYRLWYGAADANIGSMVIQVTHA